MKVKKRVLSPKRIIWLILILISLIILLRVVEVFYKYKEVTKVQEKITHQVHVTAYTSRPEETDDTPYLTASGSFVRDGVVASNFLPLGTLIKIPEYFGDKVFKVEDRMSRRFNDRIDVWFSDLDKAIEFGKKLATIEVL